MVPNYIKRSLGTVLKKAISEFRAVVLTGPRQSEKTTLLQAIFGKKFDYVSHEIPDIRVSGREDPRRFLEMHPPAILVEKLGPICGL
jgi:uncharacterized protein